VTIENWHQWFLWTSAIFAALAALLSAGVILTGNVIDARKDAQITALQPRHVTKEQSEELITLLKPAPKKRPVFFNPLMGSGEAVRFSNEIKAVLTTAGYKTEDVGMGDRLVGAGPTVGVFLWFRDSDNQPQDARYIYEAFKRVGITLLGEVHPEFADPDRLVIVVASHP
jgi:hypothetical protein